MKTSKEDYIMEMARTYQNTGYEVMELYKKLNGENTPEHLSHVAVAATNIHFAVELGLKALASYSFLNFDSEGHTHDFVKLFGYLSDRRKEEIANEYETKMGYLDKSSFYGLAISKKKNKVNEALKDYTSDLPSMLEKHRKGFETWRYNYDYKDAAVLFFDYTALSIFFQILQIHAGQFKYSLQARMARKGSF